jgi:ABC-type multidrug transport system permease subunit
MSAAGSPLRWLVADSLVLARRQLAHIRQIPEKLLDVTLQPIMFTLLFAYVFGGVIAVPDGSYREYLIGGVLVQSLGFGVIGPATSIATDLREGVVDRLLTLPMARAAYLLGHVIAEMGAFVIAVTMLSLSGLLVGWQIHTDLLHALGGYGLIFLFAFAMLWCGTLMGIAVRSPDAAQGLVFMIIFPMTFLATTFVPIDGFSPTLRVIASWNPISAMAAAVRTLFGNPVGATPAEVAWPLAHPVLASVGWCLLIIAIALPLTLRQFRARTTG